MSKQWQEDKDGQETRFIIVMPDGRTKFKFEVRTKGRELQSRAILTSMRRLQKVRRHG